MEKIKRVSKRIKLGGKTTEVEVVKYLHDDAVVTTFKAGASFIYEIDTDKRSF